MFIHYSPRLTEEEEEEEEDDDDDEDEQNVWAAISRTPILNMILVKLKVAINVGAPVQHAYTMKESGEQLTSAF